MELTLTTPADALKRDEKGKLAAAREIAAKAEAEGRDFTDTERATVKGLVEEAKELGRKYATAAEDAELLDAIKAHDAGIAVNAPGPKSTSKGSLGHRFTTDAGLEDYLKRLRGHDGYVGEKTRIHSDAVHFNGIKDILGYGGRKDILGITTGDPDVAGPAGALVTPDFRGLLDLFATFQRPLVLRDIVSNGTTTSDTISYARILDVVNNAAPVAEASGTSAGDASGDVTGQKPESSMEIEPKSDTVKTIAHWLPMTKRALSDAAQIRTLVDTFLRYGLEEELEDQMVTGDGTGENFEGLLSVSGTQNQSFATDIFVTLRKAKTKAQTIGRGRDLSVLVSPATDEVIDLMQDGNERYFGNGPFSGTSPDTIWGMRRVVTEAVDDDTAIVGDFRWAVLYDREQAAVQLSDSHADFFTRNLVAILAELRAGFAVIRPAAFVITEAHA